MRSTVITVVVLLAVTAAAGQDAQSILPRSADHADYKVTGEWRGTPAKVRLESASDRMFRTQFLRASRQPPNFAGHYRVATWGCGTQCVAGGIVDLATGQLYPLPGSIGTTGWEKWIFCTSLFRVGDLANKKEVETRADSRLLTIRCADVNGPDGGSYEHTSYFDFEDSTFRKVAERTGSRVF